MDTNYCRRCGKPLNHVEMDAYVCSDGHKTFDNPAPTVGVFFVTDDNNILMSERGIEPNKGMLDSFGGFLESGESFQDAAIRELREELGLEPHEYEPLQYLTAAAGDYPFEGEVHSIVNVLFWSRLTTSRELTAADDVAAIRSVALDTINLDDLHASDIEAGIVELRKRIA